MPLGRGLFLLVERCCEKRGNEDREIEIGEKSRHGRDLWSIYCVPNGKDSTPNMKSNFWMETITSFSILQMRKLELSEVIHPGPHNE